MRIRRRIGDFYSPVWEVLPLLFLAALIGYTLAAVVPERIKAAAAHPEGVGTEPVVFFAPVMAICLYVICTFGGWIALQVEDPTRDVNWLLVRLNPSRVIADPERKERYLGATVRTLFLIKTFLLVAFLVAQVWWAPPVA